MSEYSSTQTYSKERAQGQRQRCALELWNLGFCRAILACGAGLDRQDMIVGYTVGRKFWFDKLWLS
jgi:hypothetical protein